MTVGPIFALTIVLSGLFATTSVAQETMIEGSRLAREVNKIFGNSRIVLNGLSPTRLDSGNTQSFHNVAGSFLELSHPIVSYRKILTVPEQGFSHRYSPATNYYDEYYFNIADVNTQTVNVVAVPGAFNVIFGMESSGPEGVWNCVRRLLPANSRQDCPELIAGDQIWNRPVQWTAPMVVVRLIPTVFDGGLVFNVDSVALTGRMAMTGSRPGGGPVCGSAVDCCNICGVTSRYLSNLSDPGQSTFAREIAGAFSEKAVRSSLAATMAARLRNLGISGPIRSARMSGSNLVIVR